MGNILSNVFVLILGFCFLSGRGLVIGIEGAVQTIHLPQNDLGGYILLTMAVYGFIPYKLRHKLRMPDLSAFLKHYIRSEKLPTSLPEESEEEEAEEKEEVK